MPIYAPNFVYIFVLPVKNKPIKMLIITRFLNQGPLKQIFNSHFIIEIYIKKAINFLNIMK